MKKFWGVVGVTMTVIATIAALFCIVVLIACAINGQTFVEQITDWFGKASSVIDPEEGIEGTSAFFRLMFRG